MILNYVVFFFLNKNYASLQPVGRIMQTVLKCQQIMQPLHNMKENYQSTGKRFLTNFVQSIKPGDSYV